jgi:hypothetical protein
MGPPLAKATKSSVAVSYVPKNRHPESSDHYPGVVAILNRDTRVIECPAAIQWIVQVRRPNGRWRNRYFCRTKAGLLRYAPKPTAVELLMLPDRFPEPRDQCIDCDKAALQILCEEDAVQ